MGMGLGYINGHLICPPSLRKTCWPSEFKLKSVLLAGYSIFFLALTGWAFGSEKSFLVVEGLGGVPWVFSSGKKDLFSFIERGNKLMVGSSPFI